MNYMTILIFVAAISMVFYSVLILIFYQGWNKINAFVPKGNEVNLEPLSVVVPCRNEEKNIRALIACMAQQSNQNFELIIVNDHSTDMTRRFIQQAQQHYSKVKLIDAVGTGKKNALREGILASQYPFIVTTDADCLPSFHWLESLASFQRKSNADLIICPVKLSGKDSFFSYIQILEFTTLVASAAGAAGAGMPVLCNGANLVVRKKIWLKAQQDLKLKEQSGDDIFLLESVKKQKGIIRFLKSESAFVTTKQADNLLQLIKQRRRWSAKSRFYTDWQLIATAFIVFMINLMILVLGVLVFDSPVALAAVGTLFVTKYVVDSLFLSLVRKFFQLNNIWLYSFLLSLFYPFYIVFVGLSSLVYHPRRWN